VHAVFDEAAKLSPYNAIGVADSLIDLLLLPLREADRAFDRGGAEATYIRAQFFIREHLRDPELSIEQISASLGCSKRYLHMLFSDRGMTVSDYIWRARLQRCRQELEAQAGKTITDVAFSWGFSSSSHFSRVFRHRFGLSPREFRPPLDLGNRLPSDRTQDVPPRFQAGVLAGNALGRGAGGAAGQEQADERQQQALHGGPPGPGAIALTVPGAAAAANGRRGSACVRIVAPVDPG